MNILINLIPYIELFFVITLLGLGWLEYISSTKKDSQPNQNRFWSRWILSGLVGLAILSIIFLCVVCFIQG